MEPDGRVTIEGYQDFTRVGVGGFATVYRAHQSRFDRTVAVKVLEIEMTDPRAQRRFERECQASGRISNHPGIVTVLDSGFTADGRPFIVSEFMSHGTLADRLQAEGPLSVPEVLDIGVRLSGALAAVHAAGILHRDIKPQNVLVSDYGEPALADFGISAITVGPGSTTGTNSLTPLHTAPEVIEGNLTSEASDVYSLASSLYMLLAGRAPFEGPEDEALMAMFLRVMRDPVPPVGRGDVPQAVTDVLTYAMAKDPAARYPSALAFGEALQQLQAHLGLTVTPMVTPGANRPSVSQTGPTPVAVATPTDPDPVAPPPQPAEVTAAPAPGTAPTAAVAGLAPATTGGGRRGMVVGILAVVVVAAAVAGLLVARSRNQDGATATGGGGAAAGTAGGTPGASIPSVNPGNLRFDVTDNGLSGETPKVGGTLGVAVPSLPNSLNPADTRWAAGGMLMAAAVYDPLVIMTDNGPAPYLATGMTANASFDRWTITLPTGVAFHDGAPLDAAAVKATFDANLASSLIGPQLAPVQSVSTEGSSTVVVTMREPWPTFPVALTGQLGFVVAPSVLADGGATHPVGTGPFELAELPDSGPVTLTRNRAYWKRDRPYLDGLRFEVRRTTAGRSSALDTGQADIVWTNLPADVAAAEAAPEVKVLQATTGIVATVTLNAGSAPFQDDRVRRAAALATDRPALAAAAFGDTAQSTGQPFPPASPWVASGLVPQTTDVDAARGLLAEASPDGPVKVTLLAAGTPLQAVVASTLQSQWNAAGFEVEIVTKPGDEAANAVSSLDYQAALWVFDAPTDPDEWYVWFHSPPESSSGANYDIADVHDPIIDRALDDGRRATALDERQRAYGTLQQSLVDQVPDIWLAYLPQALVVSNRVVGWQPSTVGGVGRGGTPWATDIGFG